MVLDRQDRFEEVYDAYSGLILAYAARRTSDPADAADIVSEVFTVAWRRIEDVPAGEQARPWLYGVARRILSRHHRSNRRRRRLDDRMATELTPLIVEAPPPSDPCDREAIAAAFARLSDDDQELLTLVGWDGLAPDEIATILDVSRGAVRVRLHRARKRFARHLDEASLKRPASSGDGPGRWARAHPDPEEA